MGKLVLGTVQFGLQYGVNSAGRPSQEAVKSILTEAAKTREHIVSEAKEQAKIEGNRLLEEAKKQILAEKEDAIRDIRRQVAVLYVDIAPPAYVSAVL